MVFTVVVDANTKQDAATPDEVRAEVERMLLASERGWFFKVWPATEASE